METMVKMHWYGINPREFDLPIPFLAKSERHELGTVKSNKDGLVELPESCVEGALSLNTSEYVYFEVVDPRYDQTGKRYTVTEKK